MKLILPRNWRAVAGLDESADPAHDAWWADMVKQGAVREEADDETHDLVAFDKNGVELGRYKKAV